MAEAAEAAESDAALHEEAGAEAHHILQTADKMSTDGKLSIIEMMIFLKNDGARRVSGVAAPRQVPLRR